MKLARLARASVFLLLIPACDDGSTPAPDGGADAAMPGGSDAGSGDAAPAEHAPLASCAGLVTTTAVTGAIATDQTWSGAVAVTGDVTTTDGAKITIAPGTTLVMAADASIEFGWNSNTASVFANGTAAMPIHICGKATTPGYWKSLIFGPKVTSDSVLANVYVSEGGQAGGTAVDLGGPVLLTNVWVENGAGDGVRAADFKAGSTGLIVSSVANYGLVLTGQQAVTHLPTGGDYRGNGKSFAVLRFETIDSDTAFLEPHAVPYLQEKTIRVVNGAKVTFQAGIDYRLAVDTDLEFGWNSEPATVTATGTSAAPIVFRRVTDSGGAWHSVIVGLNVKSDSRFEYVRFEGGGNGAPALDIKAAITLIQVSLVDNQIGLNLEGPGLGPTSNDLTFSGTNGVMATVTPSNAVTLPARSTFAPSNTNNWITVKGESYEVTGTLPRFSVPFRVLSPVRLVEGSSLTIAPGTVIEMAADAGFEVGWNSGAASITAVGTAALPIVIRGVQDTVGAWNGIIIGINVMPTSKFSYLQVSNGGKANGAALQLQRPAFDVSNCSFAKSAGFGIGKPADDATDYTAGGNTFDMNTAGPVGTLL